MLSFIFPSLNITVRGREFGASPVAKIIAIVPRLLLDIVRGFQSLEYDIVDYALSTELRKLEQGILRKQ